MARKKKIGAGRVLCAMAAVAELSQGRYFKNPITDQIRNAVPNRSNRIVTAGGLLVVSQVLATELNKMHWNPAFGPIRAV